MCFSLFFMFIALKKHLSVYTYIFYFFKFIYFFLLLYYADFNSNLNLSAIIAINSEFVGFPLAADTVYPKMLSTVSVCPLPHATSIACRIALSTLEGVVL